MNEYNLTCADIQSGEVSYTYERDDRFAKSWPDHFLISRTFASNLSSIRTLQSGTNLSDHLPLLANLIYTQSLLLQINQMVIK